MEHSRADRLADSAALRVRTSLFAAAAAAVCLISGCASTAPARQPEGPAIDASRAEATERPQAAPERPPVIVNGEAVSWNDLRPSLVEAAGAVALEEAALDIALERALAEQGVRWQDLDLAAERAILVDQLADAAPTGAARESRADRGERLLIQLRASRGLGPQRFDGYLRRNAALRRLVRADVSLSEPLIRQAYDLRYGPRIPVRIIVTSTIDLATQAVQRLEAGEPFAEVAALLSTDESASRGGLLEPVSPADPTYPKALRDAATELDPGERSGVVALEQGFAVLQREPGDLRASEPPALADVRPDLEREARLRQERLLIGEKARELLEGSRITIFDAALDRAWSQRTGRER